MTTGDRDRLWAELLARARSITDAAGTPIDDGILETVVGLWAHGFRTHASCAGHDSAWPYVHVSVLSDEEMDALGGEVDATPPLNKHAREAFMAQERVIALLGQFYAARRVDVETMLVTADLPDEYGFNVRSQGGPLVWLREGTERERLVADLQGEMYAFGRFLKARFFSPPPPSPENREHGQPCFLGQFAAKVDEERRVALPREFVAELALKRQNLSFMLFLRPGEPASLLPARRLEHLLPYVSDEECGPSWLLTVDEDGRIALPPDAAKDLVGEVAFFGIDDRIELHSERRGEPCQDQCER